MKKCLLLVVLTLAFAWVGAIAKDDGKGDELLRKAKLAEPSPFIYNTSFPRNFTEIGNPINAPAVSTGYYFVDSDDEAPDYWRPIPEIIDTNTERTRWTKIMSGPRVIRDPGKDYKDYWNDNKEEGMRFFRNPAIPNPATLPADSSYFSVPGGDATDIFATDSTDDAFAGPMPIGFRFYFNGIGFDSFYVSTNGIICLTNRRYFYNSLGEKTVPAGSNDAYDPMSNDWYARGRSYADGGGGPGTGDATGDDYGYYYSVCGGSPTSSLSGIRMRGGALNNLPNRAAVIAPFFGDLHLSQYWASQKRVDMFGQVQYYRPSIGGKLIIYIMNIEPMRNMNTPYGTYYANPNLRGGDGNYTSASAQVVLNRSDSSVTVIYEKFEGVAVVGGRGVPANTIFRYNTTVGVRGYARHVNYDQPGGPTYPWGGEYEQYTHYFSNYADPNQSYPHNYLAIKFKQWKNTIRVVDIQYRVRKQDANADLLFTETVKSSLVNDYELLAGEERIGAIQPVCLIQNLSNNIQGPQGVNYQPQQLNFRSRFRIVNEANNRIVYNRLVPIDSVCLATPDASLVNCTGDPDVKVRYSSVTKSGADYSASPSTPAFPGPFSGRYYKGVPPYGFVQIFFPPFEPNEFVDNHIGRLRAYIIADPTNPQTGESLGDQWPFDDTTSVRLFVMKRLTEFNDDVTEYHIIQKVPMPSVKKWVNIEAEVADGEEVSFNPLPPRGDFAAANNENYSLKSPVIRMNRLTLTRAEPTAPLTGDQLRSFPIDLRKKYNAVLSVSFQRTTKADDWPRGWCDQQLVGPEPRTFVNGDLLSQFGRTYAGGSYAAANAASYVPDEIDIELAAPSPDGIKNITNIDNKLWRNQLRRGGAKAVTNVPAFALYGSNGYFTGFLETDKDSSLSAADITNGYRNGLRPDIYDDGIDYFFLKAFVPVNDTTINSPNEGAKNFRFRINVNATNDKKCTTCIPDDDDPFYVDNVRMLFPTEITDVEVSSVRIIWPYTIAPASQATAVPIKVKLSNNTGIPAPGLWVQVAIFKQGEKKPRYCRRETVPFLPGNMEWEQNMPRWNARLCGPGQYTIQACVFVPGGNLEELNDTTFTTVRLRFGDCFAYDPADNPTNDVPDASFTNISGRGLNLFGYATGGNGYIYGPSGGYDEVTYGAGYIGGSGSGQIAMKFELVNTDTIYGYQAFYGTLNQALDDVTVAIYNDQAGVQPGQLKTGSLLYKQRGWDDERNDAFFNEYVKYLIPKSTPLVLPSGTYWMVISQMGETGLELGASKSRMGMRTTNVYIPPPVTGTNPVGGSGYHLIIEKNFRKYSTSGNNLINNNLFAFENTRNSGTWYQFMPAVGNPAYAHLHHFGVSPVDNQTMTLSRGGWIPLIRPYLKDKTYSTNPVYELCETVPVEVISFDGYVRDKGIELSWETASETNNYGFYVERRVSKDGDNFDNWNSIGFVKGAGSTKSVKDYSFFDANVEYNHTYQYRLRQTDIDGTQSCPTDVITRTFDKVLQLTVEPNKPNPFTNSTTIAFNLPKSSTVKLEILDIYGNLVQTLVNAELDANRYEYHWDGANAYGAKVVSGTYIFKLTAGDESASGKMTLIR